MLGLLFFLLFACNQKIKIDNYQIQKANLTIEMVSQFIPVQLRLTKLPREEYLFEGGTQTASAFYFARTYLDLRAIKNPVNIDDFIATAQEATERVKECKRLAGTQAAMDTLIPSHRFVDVESEHYQLQKMKALLSFEYLTVQKQTSGIEMIEKGLYATLDFIFVKEKDISFYFDNYLGCVAFFKEDNPLELSQLRNQPSLYKITSL